MNHGASTAFLALWNSISSPKVALEYEAWHTLEHVPERVGLPGFIEARRYRSISDSNRYFTFYALTSLEALATPQYRDVFTNPTPWSARIRLEMRDFYRMPCELGGSIGNSTARHLATFHLQPPSTGLGSTLESVLKQVVNCADLVCAQWGLAHPTDEFPLTNNRPAPKAGESFVVMLQHFDFGALRESTLSILQRLGTPFTLLAEPAYFEFLTQVRQRDLSEPLTQRQPPRSDLLKLFTEGDIS